MSRKDDVFVLVLNLNKDFFVDLSCNDLLVEHSCVDTESEGNVLVRVSSYFPTIPEKERNINFFSGKPSSLKFSEVVFNSSFREVLFSSGSLVFVVYLPVVGVAGFSSVVRKSPFSLGVHWASDLLSGKLEVDTLKKLKSLQEVELSKLSLDPALKERYAQDSIDAVKDMVSKAGLLSRDSDDD